MPRRVLIADGTATNRIALRAALSSARYDVTAVASASDAAREIEARGSDVVIADAALPDLTSAALLGRVGPLRDEQTPAIVITSADDTENRADWLERGAATVLPRPIDRGWLLTNLRALLRQQDAEEELARQVETAERLGFAETALPFLPSLSLGVVAPDRRAAERLLRGVPEIAGTPFVHSTAEEVLSDTTGRPPDVLILSCDRDPEQGLWLLAELRSNPRTRRTGIIVECDRTDTATAGRALDTGANGVIPSDAGPRERTAVLTRALGQKRKIDGMRLRLAECLRMAAKDHLTGLFNRRYAMQYLEDLSGRTYTAGRHFGVVLIDVDHFKRINDRLGHNAGDQILTEVARRLQANLREHDLVSRFGGEEFLVILSETSPEEAMIAAERLRRAIQAPAFQANDISMEVTVSLGVACGIRQPAEVIARADGALYRAKREGRNRTCLAEDEEPEPARDAPERTRPALATDPILRRFIHKMS